MTRSRMSRGAGAMMLAMVVCVWLAPAAHAQIGGVGDAVGDVGGAVGGGTGSGGGVVEEITDGLEGGSEGSGSEGEPTGDPGSGGIVGGIVDTIDDTKNNAEETANETGGSLGNVGSGAGGTVGGVVGGATETIDRVSKDLTGTGAKKKANNTSRPEGRHGSTAPQSAGDYSNVLGNSLADALQNDGKVLAAAKAEGKDYAISGSTEASEQSVINQISKIAAQAVEQAVFPALLIVMVVAFLMVQNRIDGRDPKLALAPVDSEHDLLSFT